MFGTRCGENKRTTDIAICIGQNNHHILAVQKLTGLVRLVKGHRLTMAQPPIFSRMKVSIKTISGSSCVQALNGVCEPIRTQS